MLDLTVVTMMATTVMGIIMIPGMAQGTIMAITITIGLPTMDMVAAVIGAAVVGVGVAAGVEVTMDITDIMVDTTADTMVADIITKASYAQNGSFLCTRYFCLPLNRNVPSGSGSRRW